VRDFVQLQGTTPHLLPGDVFCRNSIKSSVVWRCAVLKLDKCERLTLALRGQSRWCCSMLLLQL
jgi:hypothetical protein